MIEVAEFFSAWGLTTFLLILLSGTCYFIYDHNKRKHPNLKFKIKYGILKRKYNEELVSKIMDGIEAEKTKEEIVMDIIFKKPTTPKEIKEIIYIHDQIKLKMKGGN